MRKIAASVFALAVVLSRVAAAEDFHGYPCTIDCSGHEAGYDWAQENDITDPSDCGGNSNSFIEGCEAWAEEQQDGSEDTDSYGLTTDPDPYDDDEDSDDDVDSGE
jgi:hypothetical protein